MKKMKNDLSFQSLAIERK